MSLKGLQFEEATAYLEKHKINEIYQSLAQSVLMDCPENPREYLIKHLQTMKSVKVIKFVYKLG